MTDEHSITDDSIVIEVPDDADLDADLTEAGFLQTLETIEQASQQLDRLVADVDLLRRTGLTDSDAKDLLYGRNASLNKSEIDAVFEAVDDLAGGAGRDVLIRLLADLSGETMATTELVLDEAERLHEQYGDDDE